jgi:hypothetical protein
LCSSEIWRGGGGGRVPPGPPRPGTILDEGMVVPRRMDNPFTKIFNLFQKFLNSGTSTHFGTGELLELTEEMKIKKLDKLYRNSSQKDVNSCTKFQN